MVPSNIDTDITEFTQAYNVVGFDSDPTGQSYVFVTTGRHPQKMSDAFADSFEVYAVEAINRRDTTTSMLNDSNVKQRALDILRR